MPSRWEQMVERATKNRPGSYGSIVIVKLLARQHARMVRIVKKVMDVVPFDIPRDEAEQLASQQHIATCTLILAALAKDSQGI